LQKARQALRGSDEAAWTFRLSCRYDSVKNIPESFEVGGHRYSFRAGSITDGYKGTFSGRSDIRNGVVVRTADMDGVVVRRELRDSSSVRSP
jgi:hypothetical protein